MQTDSTIPTRYGIAFGSNLGDRLRNLSEAKAELLRRAGATGDTLVSPVFESAPVGCEAGCPAFYNAVVELGSTLAPEAMLEVCLAVEQALGRPEARPRNVPRTVDLDLLYAGDLTVESRQLTVPHPRLGERRFVLEPLASIRPDLVLPDNRHPVARRLEALVSDEPPLSTVTESW